MVVSHSNFVPLKEAGFIKVSESTTMVSRTVPDRTVSLRDLITRHNSGGQVKSFVPQYLGETSLIPVGFERMSLLERAEFAKDLPQFIANSQGRLMTMREVADKAAKEAAAQAKREEFLKLKAEFEPGTDSVPVS